MKSPSSLLSSSISKSLSPSSSLLSSAVLSTSRIGLRLRVVRREGNGVFSTCAGSRVRFRLFLFVGSTTAPSSVFVARLRFVVPCGVISSAAEAAAVVVVFFAPAFLVGAFRIRTLEHLGIGSPTGRGSRLLDERIVAYEHVVGRGMCVRNVRPVAWHCSSVNASELSEGKDESTCSSRFSIGLLVSGVLVVVKKWVTVL